MRFVNDGYIYLERKFFKHPFWEEKRKFSQAEAWLDLIQMANYKENKVLIGNQSIEVPRGGLVFSLRELGKRWGWSKDKVRAFLDLLESQGTITLKPRHKTRHPLSMLIIVNYCLYQDKRKTEKTLNETSSRHSQDTQAYEGGKNKEVGVSKERKESKENNNVHKRLVAEFKKLYMRSYGGEYVGKTEDYRNAHALVKKLGYDECVRRLNNAFDYNYWFGKPKAFGQFVKHVNELVTPPDKRGGENEGNDPANEYIERTGRT